MLEESISEDSIHNKEMNSEPLILNLDGTATNNKKDEKNEKEKELKINNNLETDFKDKNSEISSIKSFSKRERYGFIFCLLAQFVWTSNSVYLKFITQHYKNRFKNKTFLFPRGLAIIIISYYLGKHYDGKIYKLSELTPQIRKCVLIRANVSFFGMCFWLVAVYYLRITTCQIISTLGPIVQIYFSVIFLNEKFYSRYTVGVIAGIIGSCIIVLNENKLANKKDDSSFTNSDVFIGLVSILANIAISGVVGVVNKIMADKKISLYTQLFYFGIFHCSYSFLWMLFTMDFGYTLPYFIICGSHACLFFVGNYFNYSGLKLIDLSKTSIIQYTKIIFVFLLGTILLGEKIFFSDIIGSLIIVSFMIYHVMHPLK